MNLVACVGDIGSGKTTFLAMVGYNSDREILSNFHLNLEKCYIIEPMELITLGENKVVLLDEIYTWLEARVSSSFINRYVSYIIFQSRKRTIDIYGTMQLFSSADLRFRRMVNKIVKCERIPNRNKPKEEWDFKYSIMNVSNGRIRRFRVRYEKAKKYFPLFDTKEIIEPFDKESLELGVLKNRPKKLYDKIEEIALDLKGKYKKITHASLKMALLREGYDISYEPLIYALLKELEEEKELKEETSKEEEIFEEEKEEIIIEEKEEKRVNKKYDFDSDLFDYE